MVLENEVNMTEEKKEELVEESKPSMEFLEIETKYKADEIDLMDFKGLVEQLEGAADAFGRVGYVESYDTYYTNKEGRFLRHRHPPKGKKGIEQLTPKIKHVETNNYVRTEPNLELPPGKNSQELINLWMECLGFTPNFSIYKYCHIYKFEDATLVYYSVKDESGKLKHFIEIEVTEGLPKDEKEAWTIIEKYEKILEPLGISSKNRKRLSLFEMYRK